MKIQRSIRCLTAIVGVLSGLNLNVSAQQPAPPARPQPTAEQQENLRLSEQDRQKMMDLLGITSLRLGPTSRNEPQPGRLGLVNYDESKANPHPDLPDPLVLKNGKRVTSAKMWWDQRRPEILEDFDREVYGRMPRNTPKVKWEVASTTDGVDGDIATVTKQLVGHVDNSAFPQVTVDIQLTVTVPANASGPVRVVMQFGGGGRGPAIAPSALPRAGVRRERPPAVQHGISSSWPRDGDTPPWFPRAFRPTMAPVSAKASSA